MNFWNKNMKYYVFSELETLEFYAYFLVIERLSDKSLMKIKYS